MISNLLGDFTAWLFGSFRGAFVWHCGYIRLCMRPCATLHNPKNSSKILRLVKFIANFTLCVNLTHSVRALSSLRDLLASPANPLGFSWQSINSFFKFHALRENALRACLVVIARICVANSWQSINQNSFYKCQMSAKHEIQPLQVLR